MAGYSVRLNEEGDLEVVGDAPGMIKWFLEADILCDLKVCDEVLQGLADVRAGRRADFTMGRNLTRLTIGPSGASHTIGARLTRNPAVPISLDELEEALRRARAVIVASPQAD